jgi:hypothetical protein
MRQSAGKSVANRLSASVMPQQAIEECWTTVRCSGVRVRSPVLLKTTSHRRAGSWGSNPAIPFQYSGLPRAHAMC